MEQPPDDNLYLGIVLTAVVAKIFIGNKDKKKKNPVALVGKEITLSAQLTFSGTQQF